MNLEDLIYDKKISITHELLLSIFKFREYQRSIRLAGSLSIGHSSKVHFWCNFTDVGLKHSVALGDKQRILAAPSVALPASIKAKITVLFGNKLWKKLSDFRCRRRVVSAGRHRPPDLPEAVHVSLRRRQHLDRDRRLQLGSLHLSRQLHPRLVDGQVKKSGVSQNVAKSWFYSHFFENKSLLICWNWFWRMVGSKVTFHGSVSRLLPAMLNALGCNQTSVATGKEIKKFGGLYSC